MIKNNKNIDATAIIDKSTYIHPRTIIGKNVKIGPNCTIGYDGFQYSRDKNNIPQFVEHKGGVIIEDNVEIYANVTVARGVDKNDYTIIRKNTKIDNLVDVAHNCEMGKGTLVSAGVIFGGSVKTGKNNFFGINCTIKPGIVIGNYNMIGMGSVVTKNIPDCEIWVGNPAKKLRDNVIFKNK